MNIVTVDEHSFDLDLIPGNAIVLDAGCRGFEFANYFRFKAHHVMAIDIDEFDGDYARLGLSTHSGVKCVSQDADLQARRLTDIGTKQVTTITIPEMEEMMGSKFDLIKLDIEGEEYEILKQAVHPIAKQVSVEFHAHCGQSKESLDNLLDELNKYYTIHNRVWEERHGAGFNYWDVLLISKT